MKLISESDVRLYFLESVRHVHFIEYHTEKANIQINFAINELIYLLRDNRIYTYSIYIH